MTTIYIDSDYKCHTVNDGTMTAIETSVFDGKCSEYIEGYRFVPAGAQWTRSDGVVFNGEMVAAWKSYSDLYSIQRTYEQEMLRKYAKDLAELDAAFLEVQYQNLVEGL